MCQNMIRNFSSTDEHVTFRDLDNLIYQWQIDLPEYYKQFILQADEIQAWMFKQDSLKAKLLPLQRKLHQLRWVQHELDLELHRINAIFQECNKLEKKIMEDPKFRFNHNVPVDIYRTNTYHLAEVINKDFMLVKNFLDNFIESVPMVATLDNTVEAVAQILQFHLQQLEDIEMKIYKMQKTLNEVTFYKQQALNKLGLKENKI